MSRYLMVGAAVLLTGVLAGCGLSTPAFTT